MKAVALVVIASLLLLPGCFIFDLAFSILGVAWNVLESVLGALFFWLAPDAPPDALPATFDEPLPVARALALVEPLGPENTPVLVPTESVPAFDPGPPPRPGARLCAIPVTGD
ncbi:MAG: hypothetical protein MUE73_08085 [Planctomycetes bacterium]|jgi:hypothetical protein|nr:hypothetical protein [Planctomycetota bacterium]